MPDMNSQLGQWILLQRQWIEAGDINPGGMVLSQTGDPSIVDAYNAPFPDPRYKAGPLALPQLIPLTRAYGGVSENLAAWEVFRRWEKPFLTAFTTDENMAISEFPKWRKYLISLSFRDKSSVRPVQVGGFEANIVVHRSTAVRGRGGPPPPWESSCRTRTGPVEADGTVDAPNAPTAPWKTLRVFHELPQGLSHRITHAKPRKAPKWRWETRIDPRI